MVRTLRARTRALQRVVYYQRVHLKRWAPVLFGILLLPFFLLGIFVILQGAKMRRTRGWGQVTTNRRVFSINAEGRITQEMAWSDVVGTYVRRRNGALVAAGVRDASGRMVLFDAYCHEAEAFLDRVTRATMTTQGEDGRSTRATDRYAAEYMPGAGRLLLRDKITTRWGLAVLGAMMLWCGGGAAATFAGALPGSSLGVALFLTAMTAFFALLAMGLTVVRTAVSEREVQVQLGLWGPRVPVERIRGSRVVAYDWKRFGGWGIKRSSVGTWAYVLGSGGDVVELSWTDEDGVLKRALFSASDPPAVVAAIEQARAGLATPRLRVASDFARANEPIADREVELVRAAEREEEDVEKEVDPSGQRKRL